MRSDYFDILPIRPPPKRLETISSYMIRLAQANGIKSLRGLLVLLSLERHIHVYDAGVFADFPPVSFSTLPVAAACSEARLLEMTFYHLIKKFNRPLDPRFVSRFLASSIARRLRYCPLCLIEFGYYSLCWRFSVLTGCIYHSCHLLDKCGHCGQLLPVTTTPPKLGICPQCNGDLRSCPTTLLTAVAQRNVAERHQELEFLLSPHPCDLEGDKTLQHLGQQLAYLRKSRRESKLDIAQVIGEPLYRLAAIEQGDSLRTGGVTFQSIVKYAQHFETTLSSLVDVGGNAENVTLWSEGKSNLTPLSIVTIGENELLAKVRDAVESIKLRGKPVTKMAVARILKIHPRTLCRFDSIKAFLEQAIERPVRHSSPCAEEELLSRVKVAVDYLKLEGSPISQQAVAGVASVDLHALRRSSGARVIIDRAAEEYRAMRLEQRGDELISDLQEAFDTLTSKGEAITRRAIFREFHVKVLNLELYPRARVFLDQLVPPQTGKQARGEEGELSSHVREAREKRMHQFQQREEELIRQISTAIENLLAHNVWVSQEAVARFLKVASRTLNRYPRVRVHLGQAVRDAQEKQINKREEELLIRMELAVRQLEAQRKTVNMSSIAELLHMTTGALRNYSRVWAAVKQVLSEHAESKVQSREARLADSIKASIRILESSREPVNYQTISELTGLSVGFLKRRDCFN